MKTLSLSSLNKVFKKSEPNFSEFTEFSCLKNEVFSYQIAFKPETSEETHIEVFVDSELYGNIKLFIVRNIPAGKTTNENADTFHYDLTLKEYPDMLEPVEGKFTAKKGEWSSLWVEYSPTDGICGKKNISVTLSAGETKVTNTFKLEILDNELPKQELLYTNWFHNDCLCTYYGVEVFSDEYWEMVESYIKNAVKHGMNMILTPIFTPPLDTEVGKERPTVQLVKVKKYKGEYTFDFSDFERYVDLCLKCGIEAFEISHFFTQWGASAAPKVIATVNGKEKRIFGWDTKASGKAYTEFLESFSKAFRKEVNKLGIKKRCWIHVSDEPNEEQIKSYTKAAEIIRRLFPDFNSLDALSDIEYYRQGLIKTPVCCEEFADIFRAEVKNFWTYHCCCQSDDFLPNRFFSQPSQRNRILGVLLYKYDAKGFLQWGHNFWYSQYSKYPIDPFKITDAGGSFPSGDSFVVYPGKDKKPLNSLRHSVFLDAMQDLRALRLLEKLTSRRYVLTLIEKDLDIPLTFKTYPHEQKWLLDLRARVNEEIKNYI